MPGTGSAAVSRRKQLAGRWKTCRWWSRTSPMSWANGTPAPPPLNLTFQTSIPSAGLPPGDLPLNIVQHPPRARPLRTRGRIGEESLHGLGRAIQVALAPQNHAQHVVAAWLGLRALKFGRLARAMFRRIQLRQVQVGDRVEVIRSRELVG